MVRVPPSGRGDETSTTCPVQADGILDPPVFIELRAHQRVSIGRGGGDAQIQGDGVVAVGRRERGRGGGGREGGEGSGGVSS